MPSSLNGAVIPGVVWFVPPAPQNFQWAGSAAHGVSVLVRGEFGTLLAVVTPRYAFSRLNSITVLEWGGEGKLRQGGRHRTWGYRALVWGSAVGWAAAGQPPLLPVTSGASGTRAVLCRGAEQVRGRRRGSSLASWQRGLSVSHHRQTDPAETPGWG